MVPLKQSSATGMTRWEITRRWQIFPRHSGSQNKDDAGHDESALRLAFVQHIGCGARVPLLAAAVLFSSTDDQAKVVLPSATPLVLLVSLFYPPLSASDFNFATGSKVCRTFRSETVPLLETVNRIFRRKPKKHGQYLQ